MNGTLLALWPHVARLLAFGFAMLAASMAAPVTAYAQHGDYLLGTLGLLGGAQAPEGIYYQNVFSYYHASGSRTRLEQGQVLERRLEAQGTLDVYVDQNILGWTTPFKVLGANYGLMIDIPLDHVRGTGGASLDLQGGRFGLLDRGASITGSSTASLSIADIYVEPINLGWRLPQLDIVAAFGFFAPTGSYDADDAINNGLGRWAEMFSLGAVGYLDAARSWSISAMVRYLIHQKQTGVDVRVGDNLALEWGLGKTFRPASWQPYVAQLDAGVIGYAQWQVTDTTGSAVPSLARGIRSDIFGVGPEIAATTKFGRFFARYLFEFGAQNASSGQVFLFGFALLVPVK